MKTKYEYEEVQVDQLWPGDFILSAGSLGRVLDVRPVEPDLLESMAGIRDLVFVEVQYRSMIRAFRNEIMIGIDTHRWDNPVKRLKRTQTAKRKFC